MADCSRLLVRVYLIAMVVWLWLKVLILSWWSY
jgi:hypothetical protein